MKKINLLILLIVVSFSCKKEIVVTEVHTSTVQNITNDSATCSGEVNSNGDPDVSSKGICWSTSTSPTLSDNKTEEGAGLGNFVSTLTGLESETTYFVRAYALIDSKTVYGFQEQFTTLVNPVLPSLTTKVISNITTDTASSGGEVSSDGGASVTTRGVCWNTTGNPTTADNSIESGIGEGDFTCNLTGLESVTTYYVKAYATNTVGTAYGEERSFTTTCDGGVFTGDVTLITQGQIDNFGANCYTVITGNLLIEEIAENEIDDLTPLQALSGIGGDLIIKNNTALSVIEGLNNLTSLGGSLIIGEGATGNSTLTNIGEFTSLTTIGGSLKIIKCYGLTNIDGLSTVTSIGGDLFIGKNHALINMDGLHNLTSVGENLSIEMNSNLTDFCGITTLITTSGGLVGSYMVSNNPYNPTQLDIIAGNCSL